MNEQELARNMKNARWRLNHLYYIINKEGKKQLFKMNWAQEALLNELHYCNIILKARQLGFTTFMCIYALDCVLFNSNFRAGIVAHNRDDASTFFRDKVLFAYQNLPPSLLALRPTVQQTKQEILLSNNSSIRVATSMRGGTLNLLHISEFGKLCAKFPERAREVITGSLQSVQAGQMVVIESTAEGRAGAFFDMTQAAEKLAMMGAKLSALDYKFHFFPWHRHPDYRISTAGVVFDKSAQDYFEELEAQHGVRLDAEQRAWWVKKRELLGEDLYREFPATSEEAFRQSVIGAYYSSEFKKIYAQKRICSVPLTAGVPVDVWMDLGMNDMFCLVFTQDVGREIHIVDYYENSGEGLAHYAKWMQDRARERDFTFGRIVCPHDISVRELGTGKTRLETLRGLGFPQAEVAPVHSVEEGINAVRNTLHICWFDEEYTTQLVTGLENYRKEWDDRLGAFKDRPLHNDASHPSDAFRIMAVAHAFGHYHSHAARPVQRKSAAGWT